jgi:hypothetical protein
MYYFHMAFDKDPDWAPPYAGMSLVCAVRKYRASEDETMADGYENQLQYLNKVSCTHQENEPPTAGGIKGMKDVCKLILGQISDKRLCRCFN